MMTSMLLLDKMNQSTHIIWATGGSMVPKDMLEQYLSNSYKKKFTTVNFSDCRQTRRKASLPAVFF
ncbi:hypothetical protein OKW24_003080 [Peribacillus simplex]|nr:hypothetical protein [Peribacillus simplex]